LGLNFFKPKEKNKKEKKGLFSTLKKGLSKTRDILTTDISELFSKDKEIDDNLLEELEELLITSDLGVENSMNIMEALSKSAKKLKTADELKLVLKEELLKLFPANIDTDEKQKSKPHVVMVVGVNGTGKTTTLGKIAMKHKLLNQKVLIGASDTFRAAAIEQLQIWADRSSSSFVKHKEGADPAAVAFDAVEAAKARGMDLVLIDTAGRLQTQKNLMEELKKIKRSIGKSMPGAPHEILMVLDATTGQNALSQAELFHKAVNLTSIAITKLDGTAKGGIVGAVGKKLNLPINYIGVGESIEDLQTFDANLFIDALLD
jgi:fused signal recognition particle receptor